MAKRANGRMLPVGFKENEMRSKDVEVKKRGCKPDGGEREMIDGVVGEHEVVMIQVGGM